MRFCSTPSSAPARRRSSSRSLSRSLSPSWSPLLARPRSGSAWAPALGALLLGAALAPRVEAAASGYTLYGPGTAGSGGLTPRIFAVDSAYPGSAGFRVRVDECVGGAPATLLIGAAALDQVTSGFHLSVFPILIVPGLPLSGQAGAAGQGALEVPLPIPALPALYGFDARFQWVVPDPGAPFGLAASEGLTVHIGDPPLVVAVASVAGGADPVVAVDPLSSTAVDWTGVALLDAPVDVVFSPDGGTAMVSATLSHRFELLDAGTGAPIFGVGVGGNPNSAAFTPDGRRAYGVSGGPGGQGLGSIVEIDCDPTSSTYGTQIGQVTGFPLSFDQWEGVSISRDGRILTAANLGLGNPAGLVIVDVDPASATFNQVLHWVPLGGYITDAVPTHDGALVLATSAYLTSTAGDVWVVDAALGQVVNVIPGVGTFPTDIDIDGRGDHAFVSCPNSSTIARIGVNPNAPGYLQATSLYVGNEPFSLAISPDGRKVFVGYMGQSFVTEVDAFALGVIATHATPRPVGDGIAVR